MDVLEKARELGEAIVNSDEFKRFKLAEEAQVADDEAQALLQKYNEMVSNFSMELQAKQPTPEELDEYRNKLSSEFEKLSQNAIVNEFVESQKGFDGLMKNINGVLAFFISPDKGESSCGEGGCSSCSGCH